MLGAHTDPPTPATNLGLPSMAATGQAPGVGASSWRQLVEYAVFFPGSLAESVLELDAHCRRIEGNTGVELPRLACDELGADYLGFTLQCSELDPVSEGQRLFERLAGRDSRVAQVQCLGSALGSARFRITYRPASSGPSVSNPRRAS